MRNDRQQIFAKYQAEIHLLGRLGLTLGLGLLMALPFAFGKVLNAGVNWPAFWKGAAQLLPVYLPSCIVEFFVYVPMMGAGASYLGFITGNMVNLKIPCVVNGRDICKPRDAMEKEIEINTTAYRRRNLYMEKKMHIDGKNYEVVSVLPLADTENPPETAADKLKYLIQESKS